MTITLGMKAFNNLTVCRASSLFQPELYNYILYLAEEAGATIQDSVLAYHPQSGKTVLIENSRKYLEMDGLEGLGEEALLRVKNQGVYVSERYKNLHQFPQLLREEGFSMLGVGLSLHQLVLGYIWAEVVGGWALSIAGILISSLVV